MKEHIQQLAADSVGRVPVIIGGGLMSVKRWLKRH